jgi:AraC-like DNA-binding protein
MRVEFHVPRPPLCQFVDLFVFHEGLNPDHSYERLLPDGNTVLIINLHDAPQYVYDSETLKEIQACHNVWVSGIRTEHITIPSGKESCLFVINFKQGAAHPFFPLPMHELKNHVIDADLVWGHEFGILREMLLSTDDIPERFSIAENYLMRRFVSKFNVNPCVSYAVSQIQQKPDQICVADLNQKIGYSQKHFISMFKAEVGLTPKSYLKIMRFQKAVSEIEKAEFIDWPKIAIDSGFYDQAHFINDFKLFSGYTPEEYMRRNTGDYTNYIPIY